MKRELLPNERLTRLLQGFNKQRPRMREPLPKWELTIVRLTLTTPPY